VSDAELSAALPAFQHQVSKDFYGTWGIDAHLKLFGQAAATPTEAYLLYVFDDADQAGALGYHDLGDNGQPLGKVFARTTKQFNGAWTVTFSHELLEMLADPDINLTAVDEEQGRAYMYEACDAVEADNLGYTINNVLVSDFVLRSWFEPTHVAVGEKFAFHSKVSAPFELLPGGYIGYLDLIQGGWHQVTAREVSDVRKLTVRGAKPGIDARPRVGSRRERRALSRSQWLRSTKP
jgi:hypothetical protein